MVDITATTVLSQNGYTTTDLAAADVERIIDDAINQVNLDAAQSMSNMTGAEGSKTVTVTAPQSVPVKILISLMLREVKKTSLTNSDSTSSSTSTSKSIGVGQINVSDASSVSSSISAAASINTVANTILRENYLRAISRLIGRSFQRA
jgi:hypothetical protein